MINSKELRIGNFAYDSFRGRLVKLCLISSNSDNLELDYEGLIYNESEFIIVPVPLTEEWLLKFGFEKDGCSYYAPNFDGFRLRIYRENDSFFFGINICRSIEIEFIHELQNLVFILTGKDLNFQNI